MGSMEQRLELMGREGPVKRIHVNIARIRRAEPGVLVATSAGSVYAAEVAWDGPARMIHSSKPCSTGARVWIETHAAVQIVSSQIA